MPDQPTLARALIDGWGKTFSHEAGFDPTRNTPGPLFRLLVLSLLLSARIRSSAAVEAARGMWSAGWTTPQKLARSTWAQRTKVLNRSGYARYDERTSTMLGATNDLLLDRYRGDLRRLRDDAGRDPRRERELLKEFKGIGDVGVDVFFREVQPAWTELEPFADERVLRIAKQVGLPANARRLYELASGNDFPRLLAGLVRIGHEKEPAAALRARVS